MTDLVRSCSREAQTFLSSLTLIDGEMSVAQFTEPLLEEMSGMNFDYIHLIGLIYGIVRLLLYSVQRILELRREMILYEKEESLLRQSKLDELIKEDSMVWLKNLNKSHPEKVREIEEVYKIVKKNKDIQEDRKRK